MNWLNLHISTLNSEAFLGSDPVARGTWICLLTYCIIQENGGIIDDSAEWSDRKWQQLVRITKREANRKTDLWSWDGSKLVVWGYPGEKEDEVKRLREIGSQSTEAKRAAAQANGSKGGRPKHNPTENPTHNPTETEHKTHGKPIERKGKEIEREGEGEMEVSRPLCTLEQALSYAPTVRMTPEQARHWWNKRNANGWMKGSQGGHPVKVGSWQSDMANSVSWVAESLQRQKAAEGPGVNRGLTSKDVGI